MTSRWRFRPSRRRASADTWREAKPRSIARALERALAKPSGGWYVLDASRRIGSTPRAFRVADRGLVAWREGGALRVAPESCPHMGASLADAETCEGALVCPWHGLRLGPDGHGPWKHLRSHDDGVLGWVQLPAVEADAEIAAPILPARPGVFIDGVVTMEARCDPRDVIANRLDPWHGEHFHPYSFGALEVVEETDEALVVRVEKRILGPVRVEVDAKFDCPDPRTIVMTILDGEGAGSIVETHATPIAAGRTRIIEATLAGSPRAGFRHARRLAPLIRPLIERSARRLWVDDAAYAERLYSLRADGWRAMSG